MKDSMFDGTRIYCYCAGGGKTTELIKLAVKTNGTIITYNVPEVTFMAEELGVSKLLCPIYSYNSFMKRDALCACDKIIGFLFDDFDSAPKNIDKQIALYGRPVIAKSITKKEPYVLQEDGPISTVKISVPDLVSLSMQTRGNIITDDMSSIFDVAEKLGCINQLPPVYSYHQFMRVYLYNFLVTSKGFLFDNVSHAPSGIEGVINHYGVPIVIKSNRVREER